MRTLLVLVLGLALAAGCNSKTEGGGGGGSGSETKPVETKPITCPPGNAVKDGACVVVVTAEKVAAVAQQQSRIDELAKLLDQIDQVSAPVELLDGLRQLDSWKTLAAANSQAKLADEVVANLNNAVKTLRTFKASLGEVSTRLGNLKGSLDQLMKDAGASQKIEELRTQISTQVKAAIEPFAAQVQDTIQNALVPLAEKLDQMSAVVDIACGTVKLSGGDKAKALCKDAKVTFEKGVKFVEDFKSKPAQLFSTVTGELETQLDQLIDAGTKQALDLAQTKVNEALRLPPAAGSGSAVTPGSGSAK